MTATGAELRYRRSAETQEELARLVAAEGACCARGDITWELAEEPAALVVRVTVPEGLRGDPAVDAILAGLS